MTPHPWRSSKRRPNTGLEKTNFFFPPPALDEIPAPSTAEVRVAKVEVSSPAAARGRPRSPKYHNGSV